MRPSLKTHARWMRGLGTSVLIAFGLATIVHHASSRALLDVVLKPTPVPSGFAPEGSGPATPSTKPRADPFDIFCPRCADVGASFTPAPTSRLPLTLVATMESDDPVYSMATIADVQTGALRAYTVTDPIRRDVSLHAVHRGHVVLRRGDAFETLRLHDHRPPSPRPTAAPSPRESTTALSCASPRRCHVPRTLLEQAFTTPQVVARGVTLRPRAGRGFELKRVARDSVAWQLGFRSGDLITEVNGTQLRSLDDAVGLLAEVRTATRLTVAFQRGSSALDAIVDVR